jgi:transketolase
MARDRFVLSAGHSSITLYIQLYLGGFGLEIEDIESLRTWGSKTPGHPEYGHTAGVEVTTGPLGQGVGNAVGMAMAARRERGLLDPTAAEGDSIFDHHIYAIASDGDLEEGVSGEASSIAGTQQLGNLTVIYDANRISIEGDTDIAFTEDVAKRYEAYGWHVQTVDWTHDATTYEEDVPALHAAIQAADAVTDRPSLIVLRTVIAWPAPNAQGTGKAHGSALGADEVAATKEILGFDPARTFEVPEDVLAHTRGLLERGKAWEAEWDKRYDEWAAANPDKAEILERMRSRAVPEGVAGALPFFDADEKGIATRAAFGKTLNAMADLMPELWGGSADLAESNNTTIVNAKSFAPKDRSTDLWDGDPLEGRVLHFGIREHGMGAILNGIAVHGGTRVFGGTFLTFSDYMRGAVRVASLMQAPVIYIWTHDSIGLGEDGPTHQPVEHLWALRAIPGLDIVRPADANEVAAAWLQILKNSDRPAGFVLSRQGLPIFPRGEQGFASTDNVGKGGYVLVEADGGQPDVILIGTGSEVQLAVKAREQLKEDGINARVVSMPSIEWFEQQTQAYRDEVLPPTVKARVSVEAGIRLGWREYVGDAGRSVSLEHYGASAEAARIFREFGFTAEAVAQAAKDSIDAAAK